MTSGNQPPGYRLRPLVITLAIATCAAPLVHAATPAEPSHPESRQARTFPLTIQATSLPDALTRLSAETGIQVLYTEQGAHTHTTRALSGTMTLGEALNRLLAGTDLAYRYTSESTITIEKAATADGDSAAQALPTLEIRGSSDQDLTGDFDGFLAPGASSALNIPAPLIETPATVNVFSSDTLDRLNVRRLDDILQYIPGASPGASGGALTNTFTIRGFQSSTTRGGSLGSRANSVFIDGNRPAARRYHFDRSLYDRVEVLKGTSSLLYGTASPGGIVSYQTKQPELEASQELAVTVGAFDTRRGTVDATGAIGDSGLAFRLTSTIQEANQTFTGENHANSYDDRLIFKPQIAWFSDAGTRLTLAYEYSEQENIADPGILRFSDGSYGFNGPSLVSDQSFSDQTNHIVTGSAEHPLSDHWSATLSASYGNSDLKALWDTANTRTAPARGDLIDRDIIKFKTDFDHREGRLELEGTHQFGAVENTATVGFSARREGYDTRRVQSSERSSIDPLDPVFAPVADLGDYNRSIEWTMDERSAYLQNSARVWNQLTVFGGLRYTDVETEFNDGGGTDDALDYSVGTIFNYNPWINPFISFSTSLTPQVGTLASGEPVPFSEGEQIEAGLKSQWLDEQLASTLSVFRIEQSNQIESDPDDRSLSIVTGDQKVRGFEIEVVGQLTDRLSATGGYSYLDAEYTTSTLYEGNVPANVPQHKVSALLNYRWSTGLGRWDAGLGVVHAADRAGDDDNSFSLPDYTRADASLAWQRGGLGLRLSVENLFDEEYVSGSSGVFANQGLPRSVFLSASLSL